MMQSIEYKFQSLRKCEMRKTHENASADVAQKSRLESGKVTGREVEK